MGEEVLERFGKKEVKHDVSFGDFFNMASSEGGQWVRKRDSNEEDYENHPYETYFEKDETIHYLLLTEEQVFSN